MGRFGQQHKTCAASATDVVVEGRGIADSPPLFRKPSSVFPGGAAWGRRDFSARVCGGEKTGFMEKNMYSYGDFGAEIVGAKYLVLR